VAEERGDEDWLDTIGERRSRLKRHI